MDNIVVKNEGGRAYVTIIIERNLTNLDLLREASKILQREVLRYESSSNWPFNR